RQYEGIGGTVERPRVLLRAKQRHPVGNAELFGQAPVKAAASVAPDDKEIRVAGEASQCADRCCGALAPLAGADEKNGRALRHAALPAHRRPMLLPQLRPEDGAVDGVVADAKLVFGDPAPIAALAAAHPR